MLYSNFTQENLKPSKKPLNKGFLNTCVYSHSMVLTDAISVAQQRRQIEVGHHVCRNRHPAFVVFIAHRLIRDALLVVLDAAVDDQRFALFGKRQIIFDPSDIAAIQHGKEPIRQRTVQSDTAFISRKDRNGILPIIQRIPDAHQLLRHRVRIFLKLLLCMDKKIIIVQAAQIGIVAHELAITAKRALLHDFSM